MTLIEYMPNVLPIEDVDVSKELEKHLRRRKMEVLTGTKFEKLENNAKGVKVTATAADGQQKVIEAEYFLSAVGRAPVTKDIGLEKTNIKLGARPPSPSTR